uniref:Uncharacterized protein n=1 Tax=Romanomermis culicivorax TaxID=13658 RepID=A0A915I6H2_ROMCU
MLPENGSPKELLYSNQEKSLKAGSHGDILRNIYPTYMSRHTRDIRMLMRHLVLFVCLVRIKALSYFTAWYHTAPVVLFILKSGTSCSIHTKKRRLCRAVPRGTAFEGHLYLPFSVERNGSECNRHNVTEQRGNFRSVPFGSVGGYRRLFSRKLQLSFAVESQFSGGTFQAAIDSVPFRRKIQV